MNISRILNAASYAAQAHGQQTRVVAGVDIPYITHPLEVAANVASYDVSEDVIIAAILHDVVEDTPVTLYSIRVAWGDGVAGLVDELTDKFLPSPGTNRKERKAKERERLSKASYPARLIKLHDAFHNLENIGDLDPEFAVMYRTELEELMHALF